jgi:hypothetical protein
VARLKKSGEEIPPSPGEAVSVSVLISLKAPLSRRYRAGLCLFAGPPHCARVSAEQASELAADPFLIVELQENPP